MSVHPGRLLLVSLLGLAIVLGSCDSAPKRGPFDPQASNIIELPLSVVRQHVPGALAGLGLEAVGETEHQGKLTIEALSPSAVEITIKIEAITSSATQVAVHVRGYATYSSWLANRITQAIGDRAAQDPDGSP